MFCAQHLVLLLVGVSLVASEDSPPTWQRNRRQFPQGPGDWVPLTQPCPTCRHFADPADSRGSHDDIGLVPPRPPTTRQIHNTGNFFGQPQQLIQSPNQFQQRPFNDFFSFTTPNSFQQQQFFSSQQQQQQQQNPFLAQTYLNNHQLLLNANPQLLPLVSNPQLLLNQQKLQPPPLPQQQQLGSATGDKKPDDNRIRFRPEQQRINPSLPQNIRLEQEGQLPPPTRLELPLNQPPSPFLQTPPRPILQQFQQLQLQPNINQRPEQQSLLQVNPGDPFLTPPPFLNNNDSNIQIPGLDKEEIQLLYVPVETLRQRGQIQGHTVDEPFQQFNLQPPNGHFITQAPNAPQQQQESSAVSPPAVLTQSLPLRDPPAQFNTERPTTSVQPTTEQVITIQPRPVSTVRQQAETTRFTARPSTRPAEQTRTTFPTKAVTFLSNQNQITNEVTPSFTQSTPSPPDQFQRLQNPTRHRFTPSQAPEIVPATEIPLPTSTLQPHQPPLSIYMIARDVKIVDVLRALKDAPTIPVIDAFTPSSPDVFVGPANLNLPPGVGKFELPYLSNLEQSKIEKDLNIPFFVAPLNFIPPAGYSKIPFPAPHVGSVVVSNEPQQDVILEPATSVEPEYTTSLPETTTTTTVRSRGRRPTHNRSRKPVSSSRQRATPAPLDDDSIQENQVSTQEYLRESQEERKRVTPSRRHRFRTTTTESSQEAVVTEAPVVPQEEQAVKGEPLPPQQQVDFNIPQPPPRVLTQPQLPAADFNQPEVPSYDFLQPQFPAADFRQPQPVFRPNTFTGFREPQFDFRNQDQFQAFQAPSLPNSEFSPPPLPSQQQPSRPQPQFNQPISQEEVQGLFEVPPQQPQVENLGNSGVQQIDSQKDVSTEQPISSTQFFENLESQSPSEEAIVETEPTRRTTTSTTTTVSEDEKDPDAEEVLKTIDVPKKSRYSHLSVPGVKSYPNPGAVKTRSQIRSRPRNHPSHATTSTTTEDLSSAEPSGPSEEVTSSPATESTRTTSKYLSHFNRSRKPLRPTTTSRPESTTSGSTRSYTVRPLRRSTQRTSVSTKRIRKPTTPSPFDTEEEVSEPNYPKKARPSFTSPGESNEVFDDQPAQVVVKPRTRKPFYPKHRQDEHSSTTSLPSTKTYQERKDEHLDELPSGPDDLTSPSALSGPSGPSGSDYDDERKNTISEKRRGSDHDFTKKGRRRLRVRVQKRPHDNFEAAESQNHGTVNNALPSTVKPTAPDLYRFSSSGEYDFESSGKFIGTQLKGHVRNITTDILESTSTFSSPGVDTEIHKVTIASEPTTTVPTSQEETERTLEDVTTESKQEPTTAAHYTTSTVLEDTTTEVIDTTTEFASEETTEPVVVSTSTTAPVKKSAKVIRTSTTTQVSHETEICYKGKCIKTNADNPDQALKKLVESANSEEIKRT